MDLTGLLGVIQIERANYEETLRKKAKNLRLRDITRSAQFEPTHSFASTFVRGASISFTSHQGDYPLTVCKAEASLYYNDGFLIRTFRGKGVSKYYEDLSKKIEEYMKVARDIPF